MLLAYTSRRFLTVFLPLLVFLGVCLCLVYPLSFERIDDISRRTKDRLAAQFGPASHASEHVGQQLLAPIPHLEGIRTLEYGNYKHYSEAKLRELTACSVRGNCPPNADKVVIFASVWCNMAFYINYGGGEGVWCRGMVDSMERQGYTVLHGGDGDWAFIAYLHRVLGDMIKVIFVETDRTEHGRLEDWYGKGFPAWKVFSFEYTPTGAPLVVGNQWTVTAEPNDRQPDHPHFRNHTYLGYALEPSREETKFVPFNDRPMQVFILAKRVQYFYKTWGDNCATREMITKVLSELREEFPTLEFIGSFGDDRRPDQIEKLGKMEIPEGVKHIGKLNSTEWDEVISNSRLLLGIGWPPNSPSPYRALARGVPFVNPHKGKPDDEEPNWTFVQHRSLRRTPEPYVYNVLCDDYDQLIRAIRLALTTPIEPYRFERMEVASLDERISQFINADWKEEAARILELRKAGIETQKGKGLGLFTL